MWRALKFLTTYYMQRSQKHLTLCTKSNPRIKRVKLKLYLMLKYRVIIKIMIIILPNIDI